MKTITDDIITESLIHFAQFLDKKIKTYDYIEDRNKRIDEMKLSKVIEMYNKEGVYDVEKKRRRI